MKTKLLFPTIFLLLISFTLQAQVNSRLVFVSNTYNTPDDTSGTLVFDVEAFSDTGDVNIDLYGNSLKLDDVFRDQFISLSFSNHFFDSTNYNYGPIDYNNVTGLISFVYSLRVNAKDRKTLTGSWQRIITITIVYKLNDANADIKWNTGPGSGVTNGYQVKDELLNDVTGQREDIPGDLINIPLPVELTSFNAKLVNNNSVKLQWQTATEVNNYGFEIERALLLKGGTNSSPDEWKKIGFVEGAGNSNSPKQYNFIDEKLIGGSSFIYRLKQIDMDGSFTYSDEAKINIIQNKYKLFQNYPNPFNPSTKIRFSLKKPEKVIVKIFNSIGQEIETLVNKNYEAGTYEINFNPVYLTNGVYLYQIQAGNFREVRKMILLK